MNFVYGFLILVIAVFIFNFFTYVPPRPTIVDVAGAYTLSFPENDGLVSPTIVSRLVFREDGTCDLNVPKAIQDGSTTDKLILIQGKWHLDQENERWGIRIEQGGRHSVNYLPIELLGDYAPYKLAIPYDDPDLGKAIIFMREEK